MPGGDRTGPMGEGPMTGRAAGYCVGAGQPGFMTAGPGMGLGRGMGRGRGFGRGRGMAWGRQAMWNAPAPYMPPAPMEPAAAPANEMGMLKSQASALEAQLNAIQKRLAELSPESEDSE